MKETRRQNEFHEAQALRQWHTKIFLALPPAALLFMSVRQIVFHHPWGQPPMSNADLLFLTALLLAVYVRLITVKLVTDVTGSDLKVGLKGLWKRRRVPLDQIRAATAIAFDPIAEYGGYGIRSGPRGPAYIARGNRAVQLELRDGHKILVGSQRPEELAGSILNRTKRQI